MMDLIVFITFCNSFIYFCRCICIEMLYLYENISINSCNSCLYSGDAVALSKVACLGEGGPDIVGYVCTRSFAQAPWYNAI